MPEAPLPFRGLRLLGSEIRMRNSEIFTIENGSIVGHAPRFEVRTDMWSYWLEDAIEAASTACRIAEPIPALTESLDTAPDTAAVEAEIDDRMIKELRASMRAITGSAFAIDGFYAMVKARRGPHPHAECWRKNGTSRKRQITETLRHHLRLNQTLANNLKICVSQVFVYRDWAAHMSSEFREPMYRSDAQIDVDWHFSAFRHTNAINAVRPSIIVLNDLVSVLARGGKELAACQSTSRKRMDAVLAAYASVPELPNLQR